jgi:hypothetical protein
MATITRGTEEPGRSRRRHQRGGEGKGKGSGEKLGRGADVWASGFTRKVRIFFEREKLGFLNFEVGLGERRRAGLQQRVAALCIPAF